jgi:RNA polymerase primary sigma factor
MKKRSDKNMNSAEENVLLTYIHEINRFPVLSKEEEEKTAKLAALGDSAARERLINSNLRFVIKIAKRYQGRGLALEDLISEGNIGLMNAVKYFDVDKGFRFITYAVWWIRQAIIKAIQDKGRIIRLPCNKTNEIAKMEKTREVINNTSQNGNTEIEDLAAFMNMAPEKAKDLIKISQDVTSLDDPTTKNTHPTTSVKDQVEDEYSESPFEHALNSTLKDELETLLSSLEKRSRDVIRCRFGLGGSVPLTLTEIGSRYHLSRERVRQIEKRALGMLKNSSRHKKLESFIS